ncbi:hypothetical protein [Streptomyces sp. ALI-76-A]|uniref:hypothetical protein n=1 Tax=Streptomyces sp. ALI-76-A TaxID=3025736 RepID=UPI00256F3899|nr:hypothetical protein [Streptomyces sp. ALI-76-A]MDL5205962.1 hypothetical protein [Streptomyces sp. ALI-76-A]
MGDTSLKEHLTGRASREEGAVTVRDGFLETATVAVADSFSLYRIAVGHTPDAAAVGRAARAGKIRLFTPAVAFAVACGMRTCWDEWCDQSHKEGTGFPVQRFQELGGVEVVDLTAAETVAAGRLYAGCLERRITGAEVLAACHSALLAKEWKAPLVSAVRASYCYSALDRTDLEYGIELL